MCRSNGDAHKGGLAPKVGSPPSPQGENMKNQKIAVVVIFIIGMMIFAMAFINVVDRVRELERCQVRNMEIRGDMIDLLDKMADRL